MINLDGRVAIVTGGVQGIGLGVSLSLARAGRERGAGRVGGGAYSGGRRRDRRGSVQALGVQTDVTKASSVDHMVRATLERFGQIDILVNNAGLVIKKHISEQTEADYECGARHQLKGTFLCCMRVVEEMRKRNTGVIVNLASQAAFRYTIPHVPYAAAKAGIVALTRDLAYEVGAMGIRVNAIAPGMIDSPGQHSTNTEEEISERVKAIPLQRIGQPRDVGDAVAFLASDAAGYISGITLPVTGGR